MKNAVGAPKEATSLNSSPRSAPNPGQTQGADLLQVRGLTLRLCRREPRRSEAGTPGPLVQGVDFDVAVGESVGLVGDSGSGKTLSALAVMGLLPPTIEIVSGEIELRREKLSAEPRVGMIFQEPRAALNPLFTIGFQIAEALRLRGFKGRALKRRGIDLLKRVAMPDPEVRWRAYPHELSGGQCQRVMLAMTLAAEPRLLIADEPTTALDVSVQAQILSLLDELRRQEGLALWLITHDLALVAATCDRVSVMEEGRIVESATVEEIFDHPQANATRRLISTARAER